MRLKLFFQLENNEITQQYRKNIMSWIKHSIQEYDNNLFEEMYKSNNKKTFSFATILSKQTFTKEKIIMQNKQFSIILSAYNYSYALHLYNAFLNQKFKKYPFNDNYITLTSITLIKEKEITSDTIVIKMLSPIICRNHNRETLKDMYYAYDREEFQKYIRINIQEQLEGEKLDINLIEGFEIKPIQAKKAVLPVYEKMIECSLGYFKLRGSTKLLEYLYKAGIGSKKAMGFGLFEIIEMKEAKF